MNRLVGLSICALLGAAGFVGEAMRGSLSAQARNTTVAG